MTFDAQETSDGRPVELYQFSHGGSFTRVTNASNPKTVGATTYAPASIKRTQISQSKKEDSGRITVKVPSSFPVVLEFRAILPSQRPVLTIFRYHLSDMTEEVVAIWVGRVASVKFAGGIAEMVCDPIQSSFNRQVPRYVYSGICNHVLYDGGCLVTANNFRYDGVIGSISSDALEFTMSGLRTAVDSLPNVVNLSSAQRDVYWQGGFMIVNNEFRGIYEGNVGGDPDTIRTTLPFVDADVGDQIQVYAGCDHSSVTCADKFDNVLRFGGFPHIPSLNPFFIDLDGEGI